MKRIFLLICAFVAINSYSQIKIASPSSKKSTKYNMIASTITLGGISLLI